MGLALNEAAKGLGRTHPNPVVGAVVARGAQVLGLGHHRKAGGAHAEVEALREAAKKARGADLYVTLEPCNHQGRTPPCTDAILSAGIARVFIGSIDPNPLVKGKGAQRLRAAGVAVRTGVLGEACDAANEMWFKFITRKLPWVVLKAAVTLDGKLATASGDSRWVSGPRSREMAHALRDELDAVLVGIGTALADDPRLTARGRGQRDPVRVVVDSAARLPPDARVLRQRSQAPTLVACTLRADPRRVKALQRAGAEIVRCQSRDGRVDLKDLLERLAGRGLTSVLVEGGAAIHGSFLTGRLWDELYLFIAPKVAGGNAPSWAGFPGARRMGEVLGARIVDSSPVGDDLLVTARPLR
ncbi:MAG TPA: bifunctional diaminohydroxyphosphoribosylaminopyrimidine deaminase/5-amino-6-(5-phosphoribosylamino)uracil reductase RibD [Myxococcales bacterium]|nr:bifunctional diaminohydroxyphosphoribosylaminopyrimidine deaminase/5-amino-6-(5-phosphoribosylamino)uracil reductase RibD [Myxococcales bacterium]